MFPLTAFPFCLPCVLHSRCASLQTCSRNVQTRRASVETQCADEAFRHCAECLRQTFCRSAGRDFQADADGVGCKVSLHAGVNFLYIVDMCCDAHVVVCQSVVQCGMAVVYVFGKSRYWKPETSYNA